jgi:hypothetical protein
MRQCALQRGLLALCCLLLLSGNCAFILTTRVPFGLRRQVYARFKYICDLELNSAEFCESEWWYNPVWAWGPPILGAWCVIALL